MGMHRKLELDAGCDFGSREESRALFLSAPRERAPSEPSPPPVKEPAREPEDPHAPMRDPEPDPVGPAQI